MFKFFLTNFIFLFKFKRDISLIVDYSAVNVFLRLVLLTMTENTFGSDTILFYRVLFNILLS